MAPDATIPRQEHPTTHLTTSRPVRKPAAQLLEQSDLIHHAQLLAKPFQHASIASFFHINMDQEHEWDDAEHPLQDPEELKVLFTALDSYMLVYIILLTPQLDCGRRR